LIKQEVTGFLILFNTDTTLIDRPIDLLASPHETLLPLVHSQFVIRLSFVCLSFIYRLQSFLINTVNNSIYTTVVYILRLAKVTTKCPIKSPAQVTSLFSGPARSSVLVRLIQDRRSGSTIALIIRDDRRLSRRNETDKYNAGQPRQVTVLK
jgi:hypothetical protein